ncbi:AraC family ligand binding domain-containing protein [Brevibacterium sp. CS2]|uniref:AraC family ligand binding domain-containing protein n=1 Tax=Brevibacterium sp. CS2 TaxID=2575923 RepID=UPI001C2F94A8|nr:MULTISPECIES: AraC family ligand binding domain-containing protein [Actinomycetes]MCX0276456.1 AraC family ligand binding domain-containing protein [Nocardia zapadnayensis]
MSTHQERTARVTTTRAGTEFLRSPGLPQLEFRRPAQDRSCYQPHAHERFSVGIIDSGSTLFSGAVGDPVRLVPGDVILIPAGFVHACNPDGGRWEYRMIHADEAWLAALVPDDHSELLAAGLAAE